MPFITTEHCKKHTLSACSGSGLLSASLRAVLLERMTKKAINRQRTTPKTAATAPPTIAPVDVPSLLGAGGVFLGVESAMGPSAIGSGASGGGRGSPKSSCSMHHM